MINATMPFYDIEHGYIADVSCLNWCVPQHIVAYNNIETYNIVFIVIALFLLYGAEYSTYKGNYKHADTFVYLAKIAIYIFFFVYIFILKLRLYYYITGA
jgi:hypothetical protein